MADKIQVDYEEMEQIGSKFTEMEDLVNTMLSDIRSKMEDLRANGWQGRGSDEFYNEMTGEVIPAIEKLRTALEEGNQTCKQVNQVMREAEQTARGLFA